MSIAKHSLKAVSIGAVLLSVCGCDKQSSEGTAESKPHPSATATHSATTPAPTPAMPSAVPTPPEPKHDCPEGSTGEGSFTKPCEASGVARTMDVAWTGKTADDGPSFKVTNKSKLVILYGKIYVYFYDKAGKQLDVKDESATPPTTRPYKICAGKIFGGVMKPAEKAVITFSCVKKQNIPDGAKAIEGELQTVGFADSSGDKIDFYWRNPDLAPEARPKGGIKPPAKK